LLLIISSTLTSYRSDNQFKGAVAEKEFAVTTLSKLGAKMEELIQRNKLLESIADLKSSRALAGSRRNKTFQSDNSDAASLASSVPTKRFDEEKLKPRGRDPDAAGAETDHLKSKESLFDDPSVYGGAESVNYPLSHAKQQFDDHGEQPASQNDDEPSAYEESSEYGASTQYDDPSAYNDGMESTIRSYPTMRKLEPEDDGTIKNRTRDDFNGRITEDPSVASDMKSIKVPRGEYIGQFNKSGQKHGRGKMKYDNGNEYEGEWTSNKRDGKGTTKYASGNMYVGKSVYHIWFHLTATICVFLVV
jgi:hypothetical protein